MKLLRAVNDWIIVDPQPPQKEEKSGSISIRLSDEEANKHTGTVLSVGPNVDFIVNPGDEVIWGKWDGNPIYHRGKKVLCIRDSDVIAIIS